MPLNRVKYRVGHVSRTHGSHRWSLLALALVLLSASGCASGAVGSHHAAVQADTGPMQSSPSDPQMPVDPLPRRTVLIGLTQNGKTVTVRPGQQLAVTLAANWTPPQTGPVAPNVPAGTQPLRADSTQGYPAGPAETTFTALREGTAVITAHTDFACLHTTPRCLPPQQSFTVTVLVRSTPGTGPFATPGASEPR